jgi:hypothetical protein
MTNRLISYGATGLAALALWIVPSVGTRGQGTLGDRFAHADRAVMAAEAEPDAATRAALARADALVAAAVSGL